MNNRIDFITDLLISEKLNASQKEKVLTLSANELKKISIKDDTILNEIEGLKKKIDEFKMNNHSNQKEKYLIHNPKFVTTFLNEFRQNTALKFSTHSWDKTDFLETINSFYEKLNDENRRTEFSRILNHNRKLYNLLNYFLFKPYNAELINDIPKFGWTGLNGIKIGWQFPENLIKKWCEENYDLKETGDKKFPFEFRIPEPLRPSKKINGKEIIFFEDVVNVFKTEIQFRGEEDNFRNNIEYLLEKNHLESSTIDKLNGLDFYTYTRGVIESIDGIFNDFTKKSESKKKIDFDVKKDSKSISIEITQLDSYPTKVIDLENPNIFFAGDSMKFIGKIFSLCDYSIVSKFNKNKFLEIKILKDETEAIPDGENVKAIVSNFEVIQVEEKEVTGFTHKFKFYI